MCCVIYREKMSLLRTATVQLMQIRTKQKYGRKVNLFFFFLLFNSQYINHLNSDVDSINIANLSFFPQDLASCKTSLGSNGKVQDVQGASGRSIYIYLIPPQKVRPDLCNTGEPQT